MQLIISVIQTDNFSDMLVSVVVIEVIWHIDDCKEILDCQGFHISFLDRENSYFEQWTVASFITLDGQEKYYIFLICSQKNNFIYKKKVRKSGKNIRQNAYEP